MYYREWCLQPNQRKGTMLPVGMLVTMCRAPDSGYASVYMFDEESAKAIRQSKSSAGLSLFPVYTDTLVIDLDDGPRQLRKAKESLAVAGLGYQVWESGGKGFHIVITLDSMVSGKHVPYSQRKWVEALDIGADLSLYQHGRIISLPGRVHPKTGKRKALVETVRGKTLTLPMLEMPEPTFGVGLVEGEVSEFEAGMWKLMSLLQSEPEPGNRHTSIWSTAKHFLDAGLEYDTALDLLLMVNEQWEHAKTEQEVEAAVRQAYGK